MKNDINTMQKTSSDRPFRPLTPLEKEGVMIAEFMGLRYETRNYFGGDFQPDENGFDTYSKNSIMVGTYYGGEETLMYVSQIEYHTDWNWLMPVVSKCFKTGDDRHRWDDIIDTMFTCDINIVYAQVLEFIKDYNQNN